MWNHIKKCEETFSQYRESKWVDLKIEEMMETVKNLLNELKTLKGIDRRCDAYVKIMKAI